MARRTREEAEQTRHELLEMALQQYALHGIHNVSLKSIAAAAGVTHGALYWHFKNREDLICALSASATLPFEQHYLEQLQAIDQNALKALKSFLLDTACHIASRDQAMQVYALFYSRRKDLPQQAELHDVLSDEWQSWVGYIDRFLKQARKQKQIAKKTKQQPMAELLLSQVFGVLAVSEYMPKSTSFRELANLTISNAIAGLETTRS
ncbi:TetR family transcriptional regulator [Neptunomonas qingdaonensis]|uniref:Transcriptional regulator, TetR family n=1 Tax=Neptunomonas qingdaonensis TaxID=1045558 RepID=A0A1I2LTM7_9GAMM|nr:TetR family transcriptional regulator [Neptunomonas qingdaonensis]SFF82712.1 transcriptional regulator, TetR family [Neptunomonas qingdaonensis]